MSYLIEFTDTAKSDISFLKKTDKKSFDKLIMKNSISKIFVIIGITILLTSCARKIVSDLNQNQKIIEGRIVDDNGFEVYKAEIYLPNDDLINHTDERGYFKIIIPNEYEIKYLVIIDKYKDANTKFSVEVYENQMNYLKLDDFHRITKSIFDTPQPVCGLPINQDLIQFKIVYNHDFDSSFHLDKSWSEENGKPVPNATIQIQGTENIYTANENGEIWVDKNEIKYGDVMIIEDEMGVQSQIFITEKILVEKVIPYNVTIHID